MWCGYVWILVLTQSWHKDIGIQWGTKGPQSVTRCFFAHKIFNLRTPDFDLQCQPGSEISVNLLVSWFSTKSPGIVNYQGWKGLEWCDRGALLLPSCSAVTSRKIAVHPTIFRQTRRPNPADLFSTKPPVSESHTENRIARRNWCSSNMDEHCI